MFGLRAGPPEVGPRDMATCHVVCTHRKRSGHAKEKCWPSIPSFDAKAKEKVNPEKLQGSMKKMIKEKTKTSWASSNWAAWRSVRHVA